MLLCIFVYTKHQWLSGVVKHSGDLNTERMKGNNMSLVIIFCCLIRNIICILLTTLCLSTWSGLKYGSNNNLSGSMLMGDWRRPLLHIFQTGFIRPQKPIVLFKQARKTFRHCFIKVSMKITNLDQRFRHKSTILPS